MKQIVIAGKLGRNAETRAVGQDSVTSFSVAVDSRERGGEKSTTWFDVSLWGKRGQALSQYLTKGSSVCVVGDFGTRTYQANDGSAKLSLTVKASEITLLGGSKDGGSRSAPSGGARSAPTSAPADFDDGFGDDSVPFR